VSASETATVAAVQELVPGLWRWALRHPEFHPPGFAQVACYAVRDEVGTLLIDPLVDGEGDTDRLAALDAVVQGRVRIVITIPYHVRSAELLWRRYRDDFDACILGHPKTGERLHDRHGFRLLEPGIALDGGLLAHTIGRPRRAEMPLWLPSHEALAFGDAILEVGGSLRVWDDPLDSEQRERWYRERYLPTLDLLLVHDVQRVLVTHGEAVLEGARKKLERALELPPWSRRSG
jgi:glyoxylase-like metal-dependent hydrolase (beta-lactamase superfamily II)